MYFLSLGVKRLIPFDPIPPDATCWGCWESGSFHLKQHSATHARLSSFPRFGVFAACTTFRIWDPVICSVKPCLHSRLLMRFCVENLPQPTPHGCFVPTNSLYQISGSPCEGELPPLAKASFEPIFRNVSELAWWDKWADRSSSVLTVHTPWQVICQYCNFCRDLDLCRDPYITPADGNNP